MNVLHISNTNITIDNRILKEIETLAKSDDFIVNAIGVQSQEIIPSSKLKNIVKIDLIECSTNSISWLPRSLKYTLVLIELTFKLIFKGIKYKPTIIHCHDTMVLPAGFFLKLFSKNSKLIYDAHELESQKNGQSVVLSKATLIIEKLFWNSIDFFISVSSSIISWYESEFRPIPNEVILNSPFIEESNINSGDYFRTKYDIPKDKQVFVYLGILGPGRGIELILSVFCDEEVSSHVVFIGNGVLIDKIKDISIEYSNIHLHKPVPHDQVVSLVKNADVGLCLIENISLSDYYCLPNKMFEYTFAGLPILASDFPEMSKILKEYGLGRLSNVNVNSVKNAIIAIQLKPLDPITADLTELGWQKQAEKLISVYHGLIRK